jgi:hypothetical protein
MTLTDLEKEAIEALLQLAADTDRALDESEDQGDVTLIDGDRFNEMCSALDRLEALPDDRPGYIMGAQAKAAWALRRLIGER